MLIGLALPATVYGWQGNLALLGDWYRTVTDTTPENLMYGQNISVTAMWTKWLGLGPPAVALGAATGLALVAVVVWVWAMRKRVAAPDYLEFALLLLLIPLLSPQGWDYMLLLAHAGGRVPPRSLSGALAALADGPRRGVAPRRLHDLRSRGPDDERLRRPDGAHQRSGRS